MKNFLLFIVFFSLVSCCSDEVESVEKEALYLPVKYTSPTFVETYTYDNKNRLLTINQLGNNDSHLKICEFLYDDEYVVTAKVGYFSPENVGGYGYSEKYTFDYSVPGEIEVEIDFIDNNGYENVRKVKYKIDEATGKLLSGFDIHVEYDNKGNIIKFQDLTHDVHVLFDNKKGVYNDVKTTELPLAIIHRTAKYFRVNNPTKITDNEVVQDLFYEYNSEGYPVKMIAVNEGSESIFYYEYLKVEK